MSSKLYCRVCGVRVRFVVGRWVHSFQNWQTPVSAWPYLHLAWPDV